MSTSLSPNPITTETETALPRKTSGAADVLRVLGDGGDDGSSDTSSQTSTTSYTSDDSSDSDSSDSSAPPPPPPVCDDSEIAHGLVCVHAVYDDASAAYQATIGVKISEGVKVLNALRKTGGLHDDDAKQKRAGRGYVLKTPKGSYIKLMVDEKVQKIFVCTRQTAQGDLSNVSLANIKQIDDCHYAAAWLAVLLRINPVAFVSVPNLETAVTNAIVAGKTAREEVLRKSQELKAVAAAAAAAVPAPAAVVIVEKKNKRKHNALPAPAPAPVLTVEIPTAAMEAKITKLRTKLTESTAELGQLKKQLQTCMRSLELKKESCNHYAALVETLQASQRADAETDLFVSSLKRRREPEDEMDKKRKSSSGKKHNSRRHRETHSITSTTL